MTIAVGQRFVREHLAARSSTSNTTAADIAYDTAVLSEGDYTWSSPEVTVDTAGTYLCLFDIGEVQLGGSTRACGTLYPVINGTNNQIYYKAGHRYLRNSGGNHGNSFGACLLPLAANDDVKIRNPGAASGTDALGNYATNVNQGGGLQLIRLNDGNLTVLHRTSAQTGVTVTFANTTRPWLDSTLLTTAVNWNSEVQDDDALYPGTGSDVTLAANKKYIIAYGATLDGSSGQRHTHHLQLEIDGTNVQHSTGYERNNASDGPPMQGLYLHEVGGTAETLRVNVGVEQEDAAVTNNVQIDNAYLQIHELPDSAEWIHADNGATNSLTTALAGTTTYYDTPLSSTFRADGDADLSLDAANDAIQNDSGGSLSVLAIGWQLWDRDSGASGTRKHVWSYWNNGGTRITRGNGGGYDRGQQGNDDTFRLGFVSAATMDLAASADLSWQVRDPQNAANSDMGIYASTNRHYLGVQVLKLDSIVDSAAITASGTPSIPATTASGAATVVKTASGTPTTPAVTASGAATVRKQASGAATLAAIVAAGTASVGAVITASDGAPEIGAPTASGVAVVRKQASDGAGEIPAVTAAGSATVSRKASGSPSIPAVTATGAAVRRALASDGGPSTPGLTASGAATVVREAAGAAGTWGFTNGATNSGNDAAPTITHGLTINEGDFVVLVVHSNNTSAISPSGLTWDERQQGTASGETNRIAMYTRVAGASEPATYNFTSGSAEWRVTMQVFTTGGGTPVVDLAASSITNSSSATNLVCDASNGRTVADNSLSIVWGGKDNRAAGGPYNSANNSFVGAVGDTEDQMAGQAYRIVTTGLSLPSVTISSDSTSDVTGSIHISFVLVGGATVPSITAAGNATVGGTISANGAATTPAVDASGNATVARQASGSPTTPAVEAAGTAVHRKSASGTPGLTALTASGAASVRKQASGSPSIPASIASGATTVVRDASGTPSIPAVTAEGIASVQGQTVASGSPSIPALTASGAAGVVRQASGAADIPALTASGAATVPIQASGSPSIPAVTAAGIARLIIEASDGTPSIAAVTGSGAATVHRSASGAASLTPIEAAGTATAGIKNASGSAVLTAVTAAGSATVGRSASGDANLAAVTASGNAVVRKAATGTPTIPAIEAAGTVDLRRVASGDATMAAVIGQGFAVVGGVIIIDTEEIDGYSLTAEIDGRDYGTIHIKGFAEN